MCLHVTDVFCSCSAHGDVLVPGTIVPYVYFYIKKIMYDAQALLPT